MNIRTRAQLIPPSEVNVVYLVKHVIIHIRGILAEVAQPPIHTHNRFSMCVGAVKAKRIKLSGGGSPKIVTCVLIVYVLKYSVMLQNSGKHLFTS